MTPAPVIPRELLAEAFRNPRLVRAFEQQTQALSEAQAQGADNVAATDALQDATYIVLSPNAALANERVLKVGRGIRLSVTDTAIILDASNEVPHVSGGFSVQLTAQADTAVVLPLSGTLATRSGDETLTNKTLETPKLVGLLDAADDAAAATGGVPVGGVYRTGSILKTRVA